MVIKCTICGHSQITDRKRDDSPIFECEKCGKYFYDERFTEVALYPPPLCEKASLDYHVYWGGFLGLVFFLFGLYSLITEGQWKMLLIGLFAMAASVYLVYDRNREHKEWSTLLDAVRNESHARLRDLKYQQLLFEVLDADSEVIRLLKEYNAANNITFGSPPPHPSGEEIDTPISSEINSDGTCNPSSTSNNTTTLFCRVCGAKLFDDSVFCHSCGQKVRYE